MRVIRAFRRPVWIGVVAVVALVVASCGGGGPSPTSPSTQAPRPTATAAPAPTPTAAPTPTPVPPTPTSRPRSGGELDLRFNRDATNWSPHKTRNIDTLVRAQPLFNNLLRTDEQGKVQPELAASFSLGADGRTWTVKMRQGVTWHDGQPLTIDDVVYSLNNLATQSWLKGLFTDVDTVRAVDATTAQVTLKRPSLVFESSLASVYSVVLPKRLGDAVDKTPVGTGPFKLASAQAGVGTTLEKNPTYFEPGLPYLDRIVAFTIVDNALALAAYRSGKLNWTGTFPQIVQPGNADQLRQDRPGTQVIRYNSGSTNHVYFNTKAPFTDQRVRTALSLAINRPEFVETALQGAGDPFATDLSAPESGGKWGLPASVVKTLPGWRSPKDQDIAQAKQLMEQAGFTAQQPLKATILVQDAFESLATVVAAQWKLINANVDLQVADRATLVQRRQNRAFDIHIVAAPPTIDDPAGLYPEFFLPGGASNWAGYDLPEINQLYADQNATVDPAKRAALINQLVRKAIELAWWPSVTDAQALHAVAAEVRDFPALNPTVSSFRLDRVWLAK